MPTPRQRLIPLGPAATGFRYTEYVENIAMDLGTAVVYWIDASDRIVAVNPAWNAFASANAGEHLVEQNILGSRIWDCIADPTTRDLYEALVIRVRDHGQAVQFTFRCDSPERRRLLQMKIALQRDQTVRFHVMPLSIQPREHVPLLDSVLSRSVASIVMCGWCKKLPGSDGKWVEVEEAAQELALFHDAPLPAVSHGICPECLATVSQLLNDPLTGHALGLPDD